MGRLGISRQWAPPERIIVCLLTKKTEETELIHEGINKFVKTVLSCKKTGY
jgi:hypothetical protein